MKFDPRIRIEGFSEDLRPHYAKALVVVAPLAVSAGTNIKVLEALACGKALISTSFGCQGLQLNDGHNVLVRDRWDEFAAAVNELIANEDLRRAIGAEARRVAESRFAWGQIADGAYATYAIVAGTDHLAHSIAPSWRGGGGRISPVRAISSLRKHHISHHLDPCRGVFLGVI